ncbi:MAG: response regulator [Planctomycetaceae bacterium]|nr:response regulator [Planctomycetaceae bacterium]
MILLDLGLPDGAGLENVRRIHNVNPDVPIVVLTWWDEALNQSLTKAGASQFLTKSTIGNGGLLKSLDSLFGTPNTSNSDTSRDSSTPAAGHQQSSLLELAEALQEHCRELQSASIDPRLAAQLRDITSIAQAICQRFKFDTQKDPMD